MQKCYFVDKKMPFKEFEMPYLMYKQYENFLFSTAVKIANSEDNRNEFEKVILKKMMIYKIYDVSKTNNEESALNKIELIELWNIYVRLNIHTSYHQDFLEIIMKIIRPSRLFRFNFSKKIEIIKKMLSFAR